MNTSGDTGTERWRTLRPWLLRTFIATFVAGLAGAFGGYSYGQARDAGTREELRKDLFDKYFAASNDVTEKQEQILTFVDMVLAEDDARVAQWVRAERAALERRKAAPPKTESKVEPTVEEVTEVTTSADSTAATPLAPPVLHIVPKPAPKPTVSAPLKTNPKAPLVQRLGQSPLSVTAETASLEAAHDTASLARRLGF